MQLFTYKPPKVKNSTKMISVSEGNGEIACSFKRTYKNIFVRFADLLLDNDYFVQFDVCTVNRKVLYQGNKIPRWGKTQYKVINLHTQEEYHISYVS